jgi:hypothetical protein
VALGAQSAESHGKRFLAAVEESGRTSGNAVALRGTGAHGSRRPGHGAVSSRRTGPSSPEGASGQRVASSGW